MSYARGDGARTQHTARLGAGGGERGEISWHVRRPQASAARRSHDGSRVGFDPRSPQADQAVRAASGPPKNCYFRCAEQWRHQPASSHRARRVGTGGGVRLKGDRCWNPSPEAGDPASGVFWALSDSTYPDRSRNVMMRAETVSLICRRTSGRRASRTSILWCEPRDILTLAKGTLQQRDN